MAAPTPSIDRGTLTRLYVDQRLSQPAIAKLLGKSERTVRRLMARYGIVGRDSKGTNSATYKHGRTCGRNEYQRHRKDSCEQCGVTETLCVHHINDDHYDNRPENLETLCNSCHMSITKRKWWAAKKAGKNPPKSNGPVGWDRGAMKPGKPPEGDE